MEHSKHYEDVKAWYIAGRWNKKKVHYAVGRWITASEYYEITGEPYEA